MSGTHSEFHADLLTPVLQAERPPEPVYSVRAQFFTAFFGGPFAILALSALNANLLGRLRADLWRYGLAAIVSFAVVAGLAYAVVADPRPVWVADTFGDQASRAVRWGGRAYALILWYLLYLPYRRHHRAAETMCVEPRNPWKAAGACVVGAVLMQIGITYGVAGILRGTP